MNYLNRLNFLLRTRVLKKTMFKFLVEFQTSLDQIRRNCNSTKWFFRQNCFGRNGPFDEMAVDEMVLDKVSRIKKKAGISNGVPSTAVYSSLRTAIMLESFFCVLGT